MRDGRSRGVLIRDRKNDEGKDERREKIDITDVHARARVRTHVRSSFLSSALARIRATKKEARERESRLLSGTEDAYNRQWTTAPRPLSRGLTWTPVRRNRSTSRLIIIAPCRILSQAYAPPLLRARARAYTYITR